MNRMKLGAAALAVAVTALIVPAAVQAGEPVVVEGNLDRPTARVSYADLNLASEAGLKKLNQRVRTAATRLCFQSNIQPVADMVRSKTCRTEAIADADTQIKLAVASFGTSQYAAASERSITVALR